MAVNHFFIHGEIPPGCNSSFIALILKVPDANLVKDFRPISLIGSIDKIIAKILSNRLVNVLGDIVNEVQSAFIAERQMLDGPFILNEILTGVGCRSCRYWALMWESASVILQGIQAAAKLGCLVLKCPFYYLGTRVGGSMTRFKHDKRQTLELICRNGSLGLFSIRMDFHTQKDVRRSLVTTFGGTFGSIRNKLLFDDGENLEVEAYDIVHC
ncbi:hypothetical protein Tco_1448471 [Tanacetum coccineum]